MRRRQQTIGAFSTTWRLLKAAAICFLFAQISWILGPSHPSSRWFIYIATAAFAAYGISFVFGSFLASGFSWRLSVPIAASLLLSIGILSTMLPMLSRGDLAEDLTLVKFHELAKESSKAIYRVPELVPEKELGAAARLVFAQESPGSLKEARKHLLSVPEDSPSYKSAQALLNVVQHRLEVQSKGSSELAVSVMAVKQSERALRVTLRNNTHQNVRNIRYRVSYFRMTDGTQIFPDKESTIGKELPASATQTFDLSTVPGDDVYASFALIRWDTDSGR